MTTPLTPRPSEHNPYQAPVADHHTHEENYVYAGFWIRVAASILDNLLLMLVYIPVAYILSLIGLYDWEGVWSGTTTWTGFDIFWNVVTFAFVVYMWTTFAGTPCKRLLRLKVLDADTGEHLTTGKAIIRFLGYIPSILLLFLGLIWVAFDKRKQGWHDKMANSVVVKEL